MINQQEPISWKKLDREERGKIIFKKAIELLNKDCPKESCEWCKKS